jgi:filamentous hemagglutinin family protein
MRRKAIWLAVASALCAIAPAQAQITTDGTLTGVAQALAGPHYAIGPEFGRKLGGNLFHSFGQFNVPTGGSATFSGPADVANVISRVTGGQFSSINGRLASTIQGANLFLVNPSGILFGPGATLSLTGTFTASTAHYVKLADGTRFEATATANPVLSAAPPSAFGFLGPSGPVVVQGARLISAAGKSTSLVGGQVAVSGNALLGGLAGDVRLLGVAGVGEVSPDASPAPSTPLAPVTIVGSTVATVSSGAAPPGRIVIRGGALTIAGSRVSSENAAPADAGAIEIVAAGDLAISGGEVLSTTRAARGAGVRLEGGNIALRDGAFVTALALPGSTGNGGDVLLRAAGAVTMSGESPSGLQTTIQSVTFGAGAAGAIALQAKHIELLGANVVNGTISTGASGAVSLDAETIRIGRGPRYVTAVSSFSAANTSGEVGPLTARASRSIEISGAGLFADGTPSNSFLGTRTLGTGRGGDLTVEAPLVVLDGGGALGTDSRSAGQPGDVIVRAHDLDLRAGSLIQSAATGTSTGRGGDVRIEVAGRLAMSVNPSNGERSAIGPQIDGVSQIASGSSGNRGSGNVTISATELAMADNALIISATLGTGDAGKVTIDAARVSMKAQSAIDSTTPFSGGAVGRSGEVEIRASESIEITDRTYGGGFRQYYGAAIVTGSYGPGDAGNVRLEAPRVVIDKAAILSDTGGGGRGGRIEIRAGDLVLRNGAQLLARSSTLSSGDAGSIAIEASRFELSGASELNVYSAISAETNGRGHGGDVSIAADTVVVDRGFIRSSTFGPGDAGAVRIRAGDVLVANGGQVDASTTTGSTGRGGQVLVEAARSISVVGAEAAPLPDPTAFPDVNGALVARKSAVPPVLSRVSTITSSSGPGGDVSLTAPYILLEGGGRVSASSTGTGNAGRIALQATDAIDLFGGSIATSALAADGGNIDIRAINRLHLRSAEISTSVGSGAGAGGNIFIDPIFVILEDGSRIVANAFGGPGGNIHIFATYFLNTLDSLVDASSQLGVPGTVVITSPNDNLSTQIKVLPAAFFDASALVREACSARYAHGAPRSTLVGVGRGGLAASPERFATSTYFGDAPAAASAPAPTGARLVTAKQARLGSDCSS